MNPVLGVRFFVRPVVEVDRALPAETRRVAALDVDRRVDLVAVVRRAVAPRVPLVVERLVVLDLAVLRFVVRLAAGMC